MFYSSTNKKLTKSEFKQKLEEEYQSFSSDKKQQIKNAVKMKYIIFSLLVFCFSLYFIVSGLICCSYDPAINGIIMFFCEGLLALIVAIIFFVYAFKGDYKKQSINFIKSTYKYKYFPDKETKYKSLTETQKKSYLKSYDNRTKFEIVFICIIMAIVFAMFVYFFVDIKCLFDTELEPLTEADIIGGRFLVVNIVVYIALIFSCVFMLDKLKKILLTDEIKIKSVMK